ncbi:MAG: 30S ribosomal protein S20 [Candidatus Kerfeldbacteria bacterium]|nr:30S ribosomal protein S20 [Candidatus Kerfeldbacteria bacterium]
MPIKASAFKALRQSKKRAVRNERRRRAMKELTKISLQAITSKSTDALKAVAAAYQAIDKAAEKGVIHAKTAARKKARLMKRFNRATTGQ